MSTLADIRTRDALLGQETIAAATAPAEADRRTLLGVVDRLTARIEEFTSINMAAWRTEADAAELQRQLDALRAQLEVVTRQRDAWRGAWLDDIDGALEAADPTGGVRVLQQHRDPEGDETDTEWNVRFADGSSLTVVTETSARSALASARLHDHPEPIVLRRCHVVRGPWVEVHDGRDA